MIPGSANPLLLATAAAGGYSISRSVRFNSSDSAYLSRTPASAGNRKTWTWSGWVKRAGIGSWQALFASSSALGTASNFDFFDFRSDNRLQFTSYTSTDQVQLITTQVFRDCSAWFHLVLTFESSASAASDRVRFYVNGSRVSAFDTATYPSSSYDSFVNAAQIHTIGRDYDSDYNNGYLADIHFIDGQALDPTSFGEFSATTGVWMPKRYAGTYGTNGFRLDFSDNSAATATTLGKDSSGNGNNWTPNNLSVTAGAGNDSLVDVPTNGSEVDTGSGGQVRGNYATLNPLANGGTLSNGNLNWVQTAFAIRCAFGTFAPSTGKWYYEATINTQAEQINTRFGISRSTNPNAYPDGYYYIGNGFKQDRNVSSYTSYGATFGVGDVIGVAFDLDGGTITFYKNGSSQGTAFTNLGSYPGNYRPTCFTDGESSISVNYDFNFGQRPFAYAAPTGFKALCTANLPAPVVTKPSSVFDVVTYTGTGSTLTPTSSLGFNPDLVWIKSRSAATDHTLYDSVRGAQARLESNTTDAEVTSDNGLTAFNSNGFTLGTLAQVNTNAATYVGWTWDAGSSTVTNTQGSITSSVRANASAGFSIVTYTGNGVLGATIGHGLGLAAPSLVITKSRSTGGGNYSWGVFHKSLGGGKFLKLNTTDAAITAANIWDNKDPTSTVIYLSDGLNENNTSSVTYVAYCFAPVVGYSSFGSYTGNGSSDGPFVFTGFRPRWVMLKRTDSSSSWIIYDTSRQPANPTITFANTLRANTSDAESGGTDDALDIVSSGFKIRDNRAGTNGSGGTFIWAAFAEAPFNYARAR